MRLRDEGLGARVACGGGVGNHWNSPFQGHIVISQPASIPPRPAQNARSQESQGRQTDGHGAAGPPSCTSSPWRSSRLGLWSQPLLMWPWMGRHVPRAKAGPSRGEIWEWLVSNVAVQTLQPEESPSVKGKEVGAGI